MKKYITFLFITLLFFGSCNNDRGKLEDKIHNLEIDNKKLQEKIGEISNRPSVAENELDSVKKEISKVKEENEILKNSLKSFEIRYNIKKTAKTYYLEELPKVFKKFTGKDKILEIFGKPDSRIVKTDVGEMVDEEWIYKNIVIDEMTGEKKSLYVKIDAIIGTDEYEVK